MPRCSVAGNEEEREVSTEHPTRPSQRRWVIVLYTSASLSVLLLAAHWLVESAWGWVVNGLIMGVVLVAVLACTRLERGRDKRKYQ